MKDGELVLPFAVHTAKYGYDWSSVPPGMTREHLDSCYRQAIALKPENMTVGDVMSGVLARDGRVVAFVLQIAKDWDANGRNAEYGAFAFVPSYAEAAKIDFRALLSGNDFCVPSRMPPSSVFYNGPASAPIGDTAGLQALRQGQPLADCDFSAIGASLVALDSSPGGWLFSALKTRERERVWAMPLSAERPQTSGRVDVPEAETPAEAHHADWLNVLVWAASAVVVIVVLAHVAKDSGWF